MNSSKTTRVKPEGSPRASMRAAETGVIVALGAALLMSFPCRAQGYMCTTPSFAPQQDYAVGASPASVAVGDFDGDGMVDLAVTNSGSNTVSILYGTGGGAFTPGADIVVGSGPSIVAAGSFNSLDDAKLDLAVADPFAGQVWILLNNGSGGFTAPTPLTVATNPFFLTVADMNNDSKADLIVSDLYLPQVSVLFGDGHGNFGAPILTTLPSVTTSIAVGLFDGDSILDLAGVDTNSGQVWRMLGNPDGTFGTAASFAVGDSPDFVATGDVNGDAIADLVVVNRVSGTVSVLLGTGAGNFAAAIDSAVGASPLVVALGDFNGDGKPDLAATYFGVNAISVLLGTGSGTFGPPTAFPVGNGPLFPTAADLNGDGKTDLVVGATTVSVLLNACDAIPLDSVVLPVKPVTMTIPSNKISATKTISVGVRNADPTNTAPFQVKLDVDDSSCPGAVAATPVFSAPGVQNRIVIAPGKTKTAKVLLTVNRDVFTTFNHKSPQRCTLVFTASADTTEISVDPTMSNNRFPVELNVFDLNDPEQTAVHETTIASLNPLALTIAKGQTSKAKSARPKVGNADKETTSDLITVVAADGTCPVGTMGLVDMSKTSGTQSSIMVLGRTTKSGLVPATAMRDTVSTPNHLAPQRCIATVTATGPTDPDPSPSNNTTQLVIDMVDNND